MTEWLILLIAMSVIYKYYTIDDIKSTSWAELGLTQAETVSLELKLKLTLFKQKKLN